MIGRLARVPFYPPLLAAYPVIALFANNAVQVRLEELVLPMTVAVAAGSLAWLTAGLLLRDAAKGALVAVAAIVMFFTLGPIIGAIEAGLSEASAFWVRRYPFDVAPGWVIVPELLLLVALGARLHRDTRDFRGATRFLNGLAAIALVISVFQVLNVKAPAATIPPRNARPLAALTPGSSPKRPDIYYIILDGYARHDVLKSHFDLDNSAFLEHLEQKGFYVARNSTANYAQTPLCLSSSLNATYLDELVKGLDRDQTALHDLIAYNDVMATLRPLGYTQVAFASGFEPTEHRKADRYYSVETRITEFQRMVIGLTPARILWPARAQAIDPFVQVRDRTLFLLDHLADVARDSRPTFTLAHLLCPHPPIVFGPNGEEIDHDHQPFSFTEKRHNGRLVDPERFRKGYRGQVEFITRRIQQTIDRILAESPEPPIIIVQSDHGSEMNLDFNNVHNTDLHERMSILNAYYFPGGNYEGFYDSISPVNSFRVVLNTFFDAKLPLLPDRGYFSGWAEPYTFIDVTDAVRPGDLGGGKSLGSRITD